MQRNATQTQKKEKRNKNLNIQIVVRFFADYQIKQHTSLLVSETV